MGHSVLPPPSPRFSTLFMGRSIYMSAASSNKAIMARAEGQTGDTAGNDGAPPLQG